MIERLVAALNSITTQAWAFMILICGLGAAIAFHKAGIAIDIAAGVVGTALNMFQAQVKAATPTSPQPVNVPIVPEEPNPTKAGIIPAQPQPATTK